MDCFERFVGSFDCFFRGLYLSIKKGKVVSGHDYECIHTNGTEKYDYMDGDIDLDVCVHCGKRNFSIVDYKIMEDIERKLR